MGDSVGPQGQLDQARALWQQASASAELYARTEDISHLTKTIEILRDMIGKIPEGHPSLIRALVRLSVALYESFSRTGNISDLHDAIQTTRNIVYADDAINPEQLKNFSLMLWTRYGITHQAEDLDESIQVTFQWLYALPPDQTSRIVALIDLGTRLKAKFEDANDIDYLNEAIRFTQEAVDTPGSNVYQKTASTNLAKMLFFRYQKKAMINDLYEGIEILRNNLGATPTKDSQDYADQLSFLGLMLIGAYEEDKITSHLDEGLQKFREAIKLVPETYESRPGWLATLCRGISMKYESTESLSDLEAAISALQESIDSAPMDETDKESRWNILEKYLTKKYEITQRLPDLEGAISGLRQSMAIRQSGEPGYARQQAELGRLLTEMYRKTGLLPWVEEAISILQDAIKAAPKLSQYLWLLLSNLASSHHQMYHQMTTVDDLNKAITYMHRAMYEDFVDESKISAQYLNLGGMFYDRFKQTNALSDLGEAIKLSEKAIDITTDEESREGMRRNLAVLLSQRFERNREVLDLGRSITILRELAASENSDHQSYTSSLNSLSLSLRLRYQITGDMTVLEEAIQLAKQVIDSKGYTTGKKINLAFLLKDKYSKTEAREDLEEAIRATQEAIKETPEDDPDLSPCLFTMGDLYGFRFDYTKSIDDFDKALSNLHGAIEHPNALVLNQLTACRRLLDLYTTHDKWSKAYQTANIGLGLIHRLMSRTLSNIDKQQMLRQVAGIASDGVAAAMELDEDPFVALSMLEKGRGVLARSVEDMRGEISALEKAHPKKEEQLSNLRQRLTKPNDELTSTSATQRYEDGIEFDKLISEIRQLRGFENFFLPSSKEEMQAASGKGPLVVINVSRHRCDAFLVEPHQISHLALPQLCYKDIEERAKSSYLGGSLILEWLWDAIARPILEKLGFKHSVNSSEDHWHRIWWIPTGLLSRFPLHAAGYHEEESAKTVIDRVMSSYTNSIEALIQGRRLREISTEREQATKTLLVAMEDTADVPRLPAAERELAMVREIHKSMALHPLEPKQLRENIIQHLPHCKIFHFAGHGYTDVTDPLLSKLLLKDWKKKPLSVATLLDLDLRHSQLFLAYLSACGTGQARDDRVLDENIHLISACQLAGFRHVVGTLWEVSDALCVDVARVTYETIKERGLTDEAVCRGLHNAVREQRNIWVENERNRGLEHRMKLVSLGEENEVSSWVPYVHFGV